MRKTRLILLRVVFLVVFVVPVVLVLDAGAEFLSGRFFFEGRMFQGDPVLGWKGIPFTSLTRLNSDGEWSVAINGRGFRGPADFDSKAERRVLVLGDSFAFGEGVDIEGRFDSLIGLRHPEWSFVNLGIMAYGTDQELIAGRPFYSHMREGDVVILLTYANDFFDILRQSHRGRPKPWFEDRESFLVEHLPSFRFVHLLNDRSRFVASLSTFLMDRFPDFSESEFQRGLELYERILFSEIPRLTERGVRVLVAHHGDRLVDAQDGELALQFDELCVRLRVECIALDPALLASPVVPFLKDFHWNEEGHHIAATVLENRLKEL